jgi:peptidoglycan/LPS O-acetylase OafA/YrhL
MTTPLPKPFSIYLDLVRFSAACLVYLYHSNQRWLIEPILPASNYGHSSVVVFFVLSGYVIAYVTATKERDWATYAASRLSRVFSVAIPAIVLTLALDAAGRQLVPAAYGYPFDWFGLRIGSGLLMANEAWFVSITLFSNVPYWSVCYESWYYVGFALLVFLPRRRALPLLLLLALLLGPKIVLLAPIWALGVLLFRWRRLADISEVTGWILTLSTVPAIVLFHHFDIEEIGAGALRSLIGEHGFVQMTFSRFFISDYLLGPLVMLHFAGMRRVAPRLAPLFLAIEKPVKRLAACTFTLYLLHQPLFLFWGAVLNGDAKGYANWFATTLLVAVSVVVGAAVTESRRQGLTRWILRQLNRSAALKPSSLAR